MRAYTKEEIREKFLDHIINTIEYWDNLEKEDCKYKLFGLAFSIMNIFDGTTELPAFNIVVCPHPDDKSYCQENNENWYEEMTINDDVMLHELIAHKEQEN